jgi:flagellar hook-associated protein 3 FlgL
LTGEDRARVAVDSVFAHLMVLRDALRANDERGITLAGEKIEEDVNRMATARADVGVRARRLSDNVLREKELQLQDTALRSEVQDLDYTEAAIRFSTLQQQLQAALATTGRITSLSLLDFLR